MGFSRIARSKEVRDYFLKGKEITSKHMKELDSLLAKDDLPAPKTWDDNVMDVTEAPFSDKLMLYHIIMLNEYEIGGYGTSLGVSMRKDLVQVYTRLTAQALNYLEDGIYIMIKNGWMEEPPQADDNEAIAKKMH